MFVVESALQRSYILKYVTTQYPHDVGQTKVNIDEMVARKNICVSANACQECAIVFQQSVIYSKNQNIQEIECDFVMYAKLQTDLIICETHTQMCSTLIMNLYSMIKQGTVRCKSTLPESLYMSCSSKPSLQHLKDSNLTKQIALLGSPLVLLIFRCAQCKNQKNPVILNGNTYTY